MRTIVFYLMLAVSAFGAQRTPLFNDATFALTPTNLWQANISGAPGINIGYDSIGRPTFTNAFLPSDIAVVVRTVTELTNAVTNFNALSIDGLRRTIHVLPGTYALAQGNYRLHVSNYITLKGAGENLATITGSGDQSNPMIWLFDYCEISDITLHATNTGPNPQLGFVQQGIGSPSSVGVVVKRVRFIGDDDNIWVVAGTHDPNGDFGPPATQAHVWWRLYDCYFTNHFDAVLAEGLENAGGYDAPCLVQLFNPTIVSHGIFQSAVSRARGDVSVLRLSTRATRVEVYGGSIESGGGTNLTGAFFTIGSHGANSDNPWPGGLYLNNVKITINGTNMVAGGVGACLGQSTNSWVFINGVLANSNNIVGTGSNYLANARTIASSTTTVGTDAATTEKDLMSITLLPGSWGAPGSSVELLAWGSYGATANTKAIRSKIGAASGSGSLTALDTAGRAINGGDWNFRGTVTRVSASSLKGSAVLWAPGFWTNNYEPFSLSPLSNIFWRITGSNHTASANDIVLEGYKVMQLP